MFANFYERKFAWGLTFSLDLFSCYLNSFAQRRLPDFIASTRLSDRSSKWQTQMMMMKWCLMSSMSVDILGTSCDQCRSLVQYSFTSTETRKLVRTDSSGRPPRLSHSSWTMKTQRLPSEETLHCCPATSWCSVMPVWFNIPSQDTPYRAPCWRQC